jgi:hypothetical protein
MIGISKISMFSKYLVAVLVTFLFVVISPGAAFAAPPSCTGGGLGTVMCNLVAGTQLLPGLFTGFAYLSGTILGVLGIQKVVDHVNNPHQNPPWDFMKRFLAGGALFALPMVMEAAWNSIIGAGGNNAGSAGNTGWAGATSAGGLDEMVVLLMNDVMAPMWVMISGFAYLAGIVLVLIGIFRLLKTMQEGPRGPGGIGTIFTFLTAGALFALDDIFGAINTSLFATNMTTSIPALQYTTGMTGQEVDHVHAVISAALAFMMVLGWVSVVRGLFILRDVAEGSQQASLMASFTHMIGGGLAINLGPLLNAVQTTLGLGVYGVNFT